MQIVFAKEAAKGWRDAGEKRRAAFREVLGRVAADPALRHPKVEPFRGLKNGFRVRLGDWRAVYVLDRGANRLVVLKVAPRGRVYK
jgi:mRNA interferase RelE/StbE